MLIAIVVTIAIIKKCYILLPEQKSIVLSTACVTKID